MIRPATIDDARSIAEVHVNSWRTTYAGHIPGEYLAGLSIPNRERSWKASIESIEIAGKPVLVAVIDNAVVGFVCFGPSRDDGAAERGIGEIYAIYLSAEHQGKGIGRALWNAALSRLKECQFTEVTLWVIDSNMRARGFYEQMGCQPDGQTKIVEICGKNLHELRYRGTLQ